MNRTLKLFLTTTSSALLLTLAVPACDYEEVDEGEFRAIRVEDDPDACVCIDEDPFAEPDPDSEPDPTEDPGSSEPPGKGKKPDKEKGNNGKGQGKPPL